MLITNGPYGAVSESGPSDGTTHACASLSLDLADYMTAIEWILKHDSQVCSQLFVSLTPYYKQQREMLVANFGEAYASSIAPEITTPQQLIPLCGLVALHIGEVTTAGHARFGIELGCNWEEEHGAGVRFNGLEIEEVGDAQAAFLPFLINDFR